MSKRGKIIAWIAALAATHLLAFLVARQEREARDGAGPAAKSDSTRHAKSTARDVRSPRHAQLWQKLLETPMDRAEFERTRDRLLRDWMKRDLAAVLDLMYGQESPGTFGDFELNQALDAEIAKNPQQVLEWIRDGRFGSCRDVLFMQWFAALRNDKQAEFILASLPEGTKHEQFWALRALAGNPDPAVLAGVRKALETWYRDGAKRSTLVEGYARKKAELAAGDTAALFAQESDPEIRLALGKGWVSARIGYPPTAERMGELRELPEDARAKAVADLMTTFDDDRMKGVGPVLAEMNRQQMWSELASEGTRQSVIVCAWHREEHRAVLESLGAIGDAATRALLLESAGRGMVLGGGAEAGAEAVFELVPQGADRDACLVGMVNALWERGEKDEARVRFQGIADKGSRDKLVGRMPELTQ